MHPLKHTIVDMLQRHIDILGNLFFSCVEIQQLIRYLLRVEIERPDPAQVFHLHQLAKQRDETLAHAKIDAIIYRVLGNEVDLFHTFSCEARGFGYDRFHGAASLLAPHQAVLDVLPAPAPLAPQPHRPAPPAVPPPTDIGDLRSLKTLRPHCPR